jgi:hypothetical protein
VCAGQDGFIWECFVQLGCVVYCPSGQQRAHMVSGGAGPGAEWLGPLPKGAHGRDAHHEERTSGRWPLSRHRRLDARMHVAGTE